MAREKCRGRLSAALTTAAAGAPDAARSRRVRIAAVGAGGRLGRTLITHAGEEQDLRRVAPLSAVPARTRRRSKQDQFAHGFNPGGASTGAPHARACCAITRTEG